MKMNLQKGLVGHWTFDAGATNNSTAYDSSAYDNHGNISGDVTTGEPSIIGESFDFGGTDSSVELFNPGLSSQTLSVWFKTDVLNYGTGADNAIIFGLYDAGSVKYTTITMEDDGLVFSIDDGSDSYTRISNTAINSGTWYHAVLTYDSSTGQATSYLDTVQQGTVSYTSDVTYSSTQPYYFGENPQGHYFDGNIAEGRMYNRALSESEISALYNMRSQRNANI